MYLLSSMKNVYNIHVQPERTLSRTCHCFLLCACVRARARARVCVREREILLVLHSGTLRQVCMWNAMRVLMSPSS
jgi:hypothetical protein